MGRPSEPFGDRIRSSPVTVGAMTVASTGVDITVGASPAPMRNRVLYKSPSPRD